jgi:hypothetical protein
MNEGFNVRIKKARRVMGEQYSTRAISRGPPTEKIDNKKIEIRLPAAEGLNTSNNVEVNSPKYVVEPVPI